MVDSAADARDMASLMTVDFDARSSAVRLLESCRSAALATLDEAGRPFASLVSLSAGADHMPLLLLSDLAVHTANLKRRDGASLLLVADDPGSGDPLVLSRLTLNGAVTLCSSQAEASAVFLRDHPHAAGYAGFADFAFYRMACTDAHLVAGFGRIASLSPQQIFVSETA